MTLRPSEPGTLKYNGFEDSWWPLRIGRLGHLRAFKIVQIQDQNTMLAKIPSGLVIIKGLNDANLVDDDSVTTDELMEVTERKTYTTVLGGSNTVFVLMPFDVTPYRPKTGAEALQAAFVASDGKDLFHKASCRFVKKIPVNKLMGYDSRSDAEFDGHHRPCRACKP